MSSHQPHRRSEETPSVQLDRVNKLRFEEEVYRIGTLLVSEIDLDQVVQRLTDEATAVCGAQFGAFFYNLIRPDGESYVLYTLSGAPREAFADIGLPRKTAIFAPTFKGEAVVRLSDVTRDPRYGRSAPHFGMPRGHLPVRSYLAIPVSSRSGEVLGGLFFGHPEPDVFTSAHEEILVGVARQAAIAIENARLLRSAREAKEALARTLAAEQAARAEAESERARIAALFHDAPAAIAMWRGPDHIFEFANPRYQRLACRNDLVGRSLREALPELEAQGILEVFDGVYRTGEPFFTAEMPTALDRDGPGKIDEAVFSFNLEPVREKGHVVGVMLVAIEVTEQVRARRAQRETERRLRLAVEAAEIGIWDFDPASGRLDWDARCKALFGLSPTAPVDFEVFLGGLHPDDRDRVKSEIARALDPAGSGEFNIEYRAVGIEDHIERWSAAQGRTVFEGSRAVRFIGTSRDITARKSAEAALLEGARRAQLGAEVGSAMAGRSSLDEQLRRCAQAIVQNLDAAFARIWTLDEAAQVLVLRASSGLYTHLDGPHSRVPVGSLKIGRIAQERVAHLSNDVLSDPRVDDKEWALAQGMVAFAGYPLIVDERVVGVMAIFSRRALGSEALHALAYVADAVAVGIDRKSSEEQRTALLAREQAALAQAEAHRARLHSLFMQAPAVIAILRGPDHVFELANASYRLLVGDGRDLLGKPIREALPELAEGAIFSLLDQVYSSGEAFFGTEVRSAFGRTVGGHKEEVFFNIVFQPTFDRKGSVDGILQISFDVTDQVIARRHAERLTEQLRKSEERYRSLIEATQQTIWINNAEGEMRGEQPGWAALTGQSYEEYQGHGWTCAVHPEDRPHTVALWEAAVRSGEVFVGEHRVRRRDGEWRYFSATSAPVREEDGSIREWFGVHTDVTEKKLVEVERERLIAALKRSNEDLDQFAYVTSHDLKAPLRGIANLSQWVEEDLEGTISEEGREHMRLLRGRVHRLEALINGILSYSRAGRTREKIEAVNVGKLVREIVELLAPPSDVAVDVPADLPTIETERVPLQQVLLNLISNAIKHAAKSDPRVTITCSREGDGYSFTVRDNGAGIAPEFHRRIWIIFQTLEPRDKVEATGIGLSIVKKIVESRGGRVWIDSALGAGASFHFSWPARAKATP
jgi:PAS domain S-box-containing protein